MAKESDNEKKGASAGAPLGLLGFALISGIICCWTFTSQLAQPRYYLFEPMVFQWRDFWDKYMPATVAIQFVNLLLTLAVLSIFGLAASKATSLRDMKFSRGIFAGIGLSWSLVMLGSAVAVTAGLRQTCDLFAGGGQNPYGSDQCYLVFQYFGKSIVYIYVGIVSSFFVCISWLGFGVFCMMLVYDSGKFSNENQEDEKFARSVMYYGHPDLPPPSMSRDKYLSGVYAPSQRKSKSRYSLMGPIEEPKPAYADNMGTHPMSRMDSGTAYSRQQRSMHDGFMPTMSRRGSYDDDQYTLGRNSNNLPYEEEVYYEDEPLPPPPVMSRRRSMYDQYYDNPPPPPPSDYRRSIDERRSFESRRSFENSRRRTASFDEAPPSLPARPSSRGARLSPTDEQRVADLRRSLINV